MIAIRSHHEREINHIAIGMSTQPRWRTTPSSSWEREIAMKMAPVLMKIAPWAIPRPGRVPERSFCPPNLDFGAAAARNFSGSLVNISRVYSAGAIYGRKGSSRRFPRRSRHTSARPDFNLGQPTCRASPDLIRTPIELILGLNERYGNL